MLLIWQQRWSRRRDLESQPWIGGPPPIRALIRSAVQTKVDVQLKEAGLSRRLLQLLPPVQTKVRVDVGCCPG